MKLILYIKSHIIVYGPHSPTQMKSVKIDRKCQGKVSKVQKDLVGNIIEYTKCSNHTYINFASVNCQKLELFFKLLNSLLYSLKNENVNKIRMNVTDNDWNTILQNKTSWKIIKKISDGYTIICVIECDIDKCLKNILIGFGKE